MRNVIIASYARTGLTKSVRGGLNDTHPVTAAAHAIASAIERSGIDPTRIEDVVLGAGRPEGPQGANVARMAAIRAGMPIGVSGSVVSRGCGSGLQAISQAANYIRADGAEAAVAGGVEMLSMVQLSGHVNNHRATEDELAREHPSLGMPMIETADIVAERYGVSREAQDRFALESQQKTAEAQRRGVFVYEIVPLHTQMKRVDRASGETTVAPVLVDQDDCNRPDTTLEALAMLPPVRPGGYVTAGNASQMSDGAAAVVLVDEKSAERLGLSPLGRFCGFAVAGCEPDEMGIGPTVAVPRLLKRHGLSVDDVDLWELNEAFASQALYCRDKLGIDPAKVNVNGGAIAIGHPFGMTGVRCTGHLMLEGRRREARYGIVTACVGAGMGVAGLFEFYRP